jgi:hypothetical protein
MSDWGSLIKKLDESLIEWPRELRAMVRDYLLVRTYEWDILPAVQQNKRTKFKILRNRIETKDSCAGLVIKSKYPCNAGPPKWEIDLEFKGSHWYGYVYVGIWSGSFLGGLALRQIDERVKICVKNGAYIGRIHSLGKKYRISATIEHAKSRRFTTGNAKVIFKYQDERVGGERIFETINVECEQLDELYPAVSIACNNGCVITFEDD